MAYHFVSCRSRKGAKFGNEPGEVLFLAVPDDAAQPLPAHEAFQTGDATKRAIAWGKKIIAGFPINPQTKRRTGHVLFFVHGFNTNASGALGVHKRIVGNLANAGWTHPVISFDWPSEGETFLYLEDRSDARLTANYLVSSAIKTFVTLLEEDCEIQVHVLAHSMGAFLVREAFANSDDDAPSRDVSWQANQVVFVSGDASVGSLAESNALSRGLYRHAGRLTNYSNRYDAALQISNAKRAFTAPRIGRHGLPGDAPSKCINVDMSDMWASFADSEHLHDPGASHTWMWRNPVFCEDLVATLMGVDRQRIRTRKPGGADNRFVLSPAGM